jgi:multidrug efflux pump
VARVELGSENYGFRHLQRPSPPRHRDPARAGRRRAQDGPNWSRRASYEIAKQSFPAGYASIFPHDSDRLHPPVDQGGRETLIEAVILVVLVMFLFLQSWRATLIPAIAVPVVLLGTFGVLAALRLSRSTR